MTAITIATWNLDRPSSGPHSVRTQRIRSAIESVEADIWVLTETRASLAPVHGYFSVHSQPHADRRRDHDERWVSIYSRWPATLLWTDAWSATASVASAHGELLVHGVVLPYMNEPGPAGSHAPGWTRFMEELLNQRSRWMWIRAQYPSAPLIVAGDLNQNLDGSRWYGSRRTRLALRQALEAAGLNCLTTEDVVASHKLRINHLVDHICVTGDLALNGGIKCWEPTTSDGLPMSDHPGVAAQLTFAKGTHPAD
jgi:endonuclease/exonuclease/phosphatase family metal-dependent hydrolase